MARRQSYFPAANLRQFEGTELAPPGAGTYFNPSRYVGFHGNLNQVKRHLAGQYQSDLAYNVQANPNVARNLEAERIGAQYGSRAAVDPNDKYFGFGTGRANPATTRAYYTANTTGINNGLRTIQLPSGGTATIRDSANYQLPTLGTNAVRSLQPPGTSTLPPNPFTGQSNLNLGTGTSGGFQFGAPPSSRSNFPAANPSALPSPRFASERGDLLRDTEGTFYGGGQVPVPTPTPTPPTTSRFAQSQPRRYFETGYV